jgi:hypothetical protein
VLSALPFEPQDSPLEGRQLFSVDSRGPLGFSITDFQGANSGGEKVNGRDKIRKPPPKSRPNDNASAKEKGLVARAARSNFPSVIIVVWCHSIIIL